MLIDINDTEQLNTTFCQLVGIKPIKAILYNPETNEAKTYSSTNCIYRRPKGWENAIVNTYDKPKYPDFTEKENFYALLDLQWKLFGSLGDQYVRLKDESFEVNYLYSKVKAIQILKAYGGSEMLDKFIEEIKNLTFTYNIVLED